jgi:hypothetical protein
MDNLFKKKESRVDITDKYGAVEVKDYCCPSCGKEYQEDYPYIVDKEKYPKSFNNSSHHSDLGSFYYWDELHKCPDCKVLYWFNNGN